MCVSLSQTATDNQYLRIVLDYQNAFHRDPLHFTEPENMAIIDRFCFPWLRACPICVELANKVGQVRDKQREIRVQCKVVRTKPFTQT